MIINYEDDDEQGNLLGINLEYSSDEEINQVMKKKKGNNTSIDKNQSQITNFFNKK